MTGKSQKEAIGEAPTLPLEAPPAARTTEETFRPGEHVAGRYRIDSLLAAGGFGKVFRAFDETLGRSVALKVIHSSKLSETEARRFREEARTIAKLDHPHIVPVFDAGVDDGLPWLAMKLIDGGSLKQRLLEEGRLEPAQAIPLLIQVSQALGHAHRRNIIHRDVKPANVLVELRDGIEYTWLADFGIAKKKGEQPLTASGAVIGTPQYMAPEMITCGAVDGRTDLFSLGALAFELLTGKPAFAGASALIILHAVVHSVPDFSELRERAGPALAATIQRCLAKAPEDRWQTAEELATEFGRRSRSEHEPPLKALVSFFNWNRRRPRPWNEKFALQAVGLRKGFGFGRPVLSGLDLTVPRGAIYALLGRNGCGKTTLLRTCLGIYRRDAGDVQVFGRDPEHEGPAVLARVGVVPDTLAVDERQTVEQLLAFASRLYPRWDQPRCFRLLARFELLPRERIRNLSRGMKTKVSLVMALSHRPDLLVLDDPTLGLDAIVVREFMGTLEEAAQEGTTILIASHNHAELDRIATHAGLLRNGAIFLSGDLNWLKQEVQEVTLTFADRPPAVVDATDFHVIRLSDHKLVGLALGQQEATLERLRAFHPQQLTIRDPSLEEIFIGLLR